MSHDTGTRGTRADSHENELSRDGSVGRSIADGRRPPESRAARTRPWTCQGLPPTTAPGGGGGSPTRPPLKSLTDFIAIAPTDIGLSEMRTCGRFADGVRAKCLQMVVTCRWGKGASPPPPKASRPMHKTTTRHTNKVSRRRLISQIRYGIYIYIYIYNLFNCGCLFILYIVRAMTLL